MASRTSKQFWKTCSAVALLTGVCIAPEGFASDTAREAGRVRVTGVELLGEVTFPYAYGFAGTEVGGLSAITYDAGKAQYYALSDDRSAARFYTLTIDLSDGQLDEGDVELTGVTRLLDGSGTPFPPNRVDPEGLALDLDGTLFLSSEGDASDPEALIDPFVNEFEPWGLELDELPVPDKYLPTPDQSSGIRNNLAFESLTITPDYGLLYTATENALYQDGPAANIDHGSLSRILGYDLGTREPFREVVYVVDAVPDEPVPSDAFSINGLVELLAIDNNGTMLALERAFSVGVGNTVKLYEVLSQGALDVTDELDLFWEEEGIPFEIDPPVAKRELLNIADLGITPDNLEGMTFGPALSDGRKSLILVSDNNFSDTQVTQFIAFALSTETIPAALPALETPQALDDADADSALRGDSDDPAIWVHPTQRDKSLVLATLKDGGLVVLDLSGRTRQIIAPDQYGDIRYNNVDLVYDFPLARRRVDIAVVSDRQNDTLAIFRIDPRSRELKEITAPDIPDTIFGVDDGEYTAYGLATYTSPKSGKSYAFVTQAGGNLVAQLELRAHKRKGVSARLVRLIELPVPTGDSEDSQAEAMVVDQELGALYVAMENEVGVLELGAEPDADDTYRVVASVNEDFLEPDIEGLAIYYGPKGAGYLLISSQGDSTYAVLERTGEHAYLGSFVVGDKSHVPACDDDRDAKKGRDDELKLHDDERCAGKPTPNVIDQANESDGIEVVSLPLGKAFPKGLLVVQDGANDPQVVVQDEEELENISTNFKFVPWENVANAFAEPLLISPNDGSGPRGGNCGKKRGRND